MVDSVEACAILLLSGGYVGYLPEHYASRWIESGTLRELLPRRRRKFPIELVFRTGGREIARRSCVRLGPSCRVPLPSRAEPPVWLMASRRSWRFPRFPNSTRSFQVSMQLPE